MFWKHENGYIQPIVEPSNETYFSGEIKMIGQRFYLLFSVFAGICFLIGLAQADLKPVAEDGPFSCIITTDEVFKPYALGKSINVYIDFQHQLEDDLILTDGLKQSNVFS